MLPARKYNAYLEAIESEMVDALTSYESDVEWEQELEALVGTKFAALINSLKMPESERET